MNRRGFLGAMLAAAAAPYVVTKAGVLMPVQKVVTAEPILAPQQVIAVDLAAEGGGNCTVVAQLRLWKGKVLIEQFDIPVSSLTQHQIAMEQIEHYWSQRKKTLTQQV